MSARAVGFMQKWIGANIVGQRHAVNRGLIAGALIARCHEDLAAEGISPHEVTEDMVLTVESVVIEAFGNGRGH